MPTVSAASCFRAPRWVVASVTARRRVSVFRTAAASAPPSAGSVPLPISSSSTSEPPSAPARARMSRSAATCAEKVERLAAMDWRAPVAGDTGAETGGRERGGEGKGGGFGGGRVLKKKKQK